MAVTEKCPYCGNHPAEQVEIGGVTINVCPKVPLGQPIYIAAPAKRR